MNESNIINILLGGSILLLFTIGILIIVYIVFYLIGLCKLFKKAGKNGWEALIPFYNTYILIEISGLNWWYFLIAILGSITVTLNIDNISWITNISSHIVNFFIFYNLAKKMHKETIATAILGTLFPGIMILILGLSKNYTYDNSVIVSPNGPINDTKNETTNPEKFCLGCGQKLKPNSFFCGNCGKKVD